MTKDEHTGSETKGVQPGVKHAQETPTTGNSSASLSPVSQQRPVSASATTASSYSVELHIEELVLHGFANHERYRIGEAMERELTRLFIEQGAPPAIAHGGEISKLDGGAFEVKHSSDAQTTGIQLAQAIYGGLE